LYNIYLLFLNYDSATFVFIILFIKLLSAPLLPLSFTLKLTIATHFYSICLPLKLIVFIVFPNLNSAARAVTKLIAHFLKYLHWLKINERIKYNVLSLIYTSLNTGQPSYLRSLLSFPSHRFTLSSSLTTLSRPSHKHLLLIKLTEIYWHYLPLCADAPQSGQSINQSKGYNRITMHCTAFHKRQQLALKWVISQIEHPRTMIMVFS